MSTFNDFYNIYKSSAEKSKAYDEFYNRKKDTPVSSKPIARKIKTFGPIKDCRCVVLIPVYK